MKFNEVLPDYEYGRCSGSYCIDGKRGRARAHFFAAHDCWSVEALLFVEALLSDDLEEPMEEWLTPQ